MEAAVIRENGILKVDIDGKKYMPLSFKSFRANPKNVSEFYDAGIRLFSVLIGGITSALGVPYSLYGESWIGENKYDFSPIDRQMNMFIENAPDGYFAPMLQLDTREWFLEAHPDMPNSFTSLSQMINEERWRNAASAYLEAAVNHIEEKYGDRVYGYFLLCGTTTEWFSARDREAPHPLKEKAYRAWCGDENASLPSKEECDAKGDAFLTEDEENIGRMRKFSAESISDTALYFAAKLKKLTNRKKLVGMYFGYLLELDNERIFSFGHLEYEKVYTSPDIDMISSPSSYDYRKISDPSAYMVTKKTLDKHGKLYFLEFDHITHVAPEEIHEKSSFGKSDKPMMVKIPGANSKCKNETESLNLMYRDWLLCSADGAALWWFDMFDGWFRSVEMMKCIKGMIKITDRLGSLERKEDGEVAVFFEGSSMYKVRKTANIDCHALSDIRGSLASAGVKYDMYSICDLHLPEIEKYKLIILANQYEMQKKTLGRISELKEKGVSVLYMYASGYFLDGKASEENISSVCGMNIISSGKAFGDVVVGKNRYSYTVPAPYFAICDTEATPMAYYENGNTAAAYKKDLSYSIYSGSAGISSDLIKEAARLCGAHIYSENPKIYVYPCSAYTGVYNASDGDAEILLPCGDYKDLIGGAVYTSKAGRLTLPRKDIRAYLLIKI